MTTLILCYTVATSKLRKATNEFAVVYEGTFLSIHDVNMTSVGYNALLSDKPSIPTIATQKGKISSWLTNMEVSHRVNQDFNGTYPCSLCFVSLPHAIIVHTKEEGLKQTLPKTVVVNKKTTYLLGLTDSKNCNKKYFIIHVGLQIHPYLFFEL